jgi:lambda family phage tail tape measure protein
MADIATLGIAVDSSDVTNADRALVRLTNTASGAVSAVKGLVGAWAGWHVVKSIIVESAQLNARFETMGVVLNVVGRNAGYSATQMAGYEQSLRKTGIAMIEARETLTRMSQAQLDLSKTSSLARVAQDAAVVGGINSSAAFERMVQGIRSGEVEILRTIGINVSFQQSYEKTAKELGKNVTALTEAEKTQSRMNAVLAEGAKLSGVYEAAMGTAGKQMQSMKRYTDDLKVKFGEVFNESLTVSIFALSDAFKFAGREMDALAADKELSRWGEDLTDTFVNLADAVHNTYLRFHMLYKATSLGMGGIKDFFTSGTQKEFDAKSASRYAEWEKNFTSDVNKGDAFVRALEDRRKSKARDTYLGKGTYGGSDLARVSKGFGISAGGDQASLLAAQDADFFLTKPGSAGGAGSKTTGKSATDKVKDFIDVLKKEATTLGMTSEEHKRYEASLLKMSSAQKTTVDSLLKKIEAHKDELATAQRSNEAWDASFEVIEKLRVEQEDAIKTQRIWLEGMNLEFSLLGKTNEEREIELRLLSLRKAGVNAPGMEKQIHDATYQSAANQYTKAAMTTQERFMEERTRVDKIYTEGGFGSPESVLSMQRYSAAVGVVNENYKSLSYELGGARTGWLSGAESGLNFYSESLKNTFVQAEYVALHSFKSMENSLTNFVMTGKLDFKSLADSIIADLVRIAIQQSITRPLAAAASAFLPSIFGVKSAQGNVFNSAGLSAYSNQIVSQPTVFPFAHGIGLMGEAGPEAIMPLKRGPDGNLGVRGGGGSISVEMTFNVDATGDDPGTVARLQDAVARIASNLKPAAIAAVREAMLKNRTSPAF